MLTTVMSVACSAFRSLESHVVGKRWRAAPGVESRDSARRRAARGGQRKAPGCERRTAQGAGLREADNARRWVARGGQRKAPNCERGTAQPWRQTARAQQGTESPTARAACICI
eukprot:2512742-Pleurochrysis_carterae.AAC.1